jgi:tripartite-type tricarboxylate transporter receptor subunit TctC
MMTRITRRTAVAALGSLAAIATSTQSSAQAWPNVTFVVPFPPGGSTDALARLLQAGASQKLATTITVENRAGGMGSVGAALVARGLPNGSIFLVTFDSHAIIPSLVEQPPLDVVTDLEPVLLVGTAPYVVAANPSLPFNTFADVIAAAKQQPGGVTYSSAGPGTIGHLAMVLLGKKSAVEMAHVPYKGAGPAIVDTVAGHVGLISASIAILLPQIKAGKLKALMQMGRVRAAALPEVPTAIESGYPDFEASAWWGIFAPKGTPPDVITRASSAFSEVLSQDVVANQLRETQQIDLVLKGPGDFRAFFNRQIETWGTVIRDNNIKAQSS